MKDIKRIKNIKAQNYTYMGKEVYCSDCENEVFVSEIRDYNSLDIKNILK